VTKTGQVIYKAEKDACRAFPDPQRDELARGGAPGTPGRRSSQILDPLEFPEEEGLMYVPEDEGSDTADYDLSGELALEADPDWDSQPQSGDVPWEVTFDSYGDSFDASF